MLSPLSMIPLRHTILALLFLSIPAKASDWWNSAWTQRQSLSISADSSPSALRDQSVLLRLHSGNFPFDTASPDGSDIRVVDSNGNLVPHQIEKFNALIQEAWIWVLAPEIPTSGHLTLHVYSGAANPSSVPALPVKDTFRNAGQVLHFHETSSSAQDSGPLEAHSTFTFASSEGSWIGNGARILGNESITFSKPPSLDLTKGLTQSLWIKPSASASNSILWESEGPQTRIRIRFQDFTPVVEVVENGQTRTASSNQPLTADTWFHVALSASPERAALFIQGSPVAEIAGLQSVPADQVTLGRSPSNPSLLPWTGEIDEWRWSASLPNEAIRFASLQQGSSELSAKLATLGNSESNNSGGHSEALEHVMLFGDIARNMMFDGWIAIGVCVIMIVVGWSVAVRKFAYLNRIQKGTEAFLDQWKTVSSDLTSLDQPPSNLPSDHLTKGLNPSQRHLIEQSPLFRIYHLGAEEIRHRLERDRQRTRGLSGRSIQAIRAALDGGLVNETHRLTKGLVYLTISIAGGPYVGLLGTVVGVMITFAIIAKSGEVDVNSIAPGIASALLATVAGLVVAIPALFIYSYLNSRIKETTSRMQVFIDEFVTRMAEFYPPAGEFSPYSPPTSDRS